MPTFAIGDIQGCFHSLEKLLKHIRFKADRDILWFTGDIVNRGPQSLKTLRFIKNLGAQHRIVLGNHDLHLLALAHQAHPGWPDDTVNDILMAPDRDELIAWLLQQPLLVHDDASSFTMVHAGLAPSWDLTTAKRLAAEVETVLKGSSATEFFYHMYGNHPNHWHESLTGWDRLRCITNYFTRLRFCHPDGSIDLEKKGQISDETKNLIPWFQVPNRANSHLKILFGHWAALGGITLCANAYALDTGCVWGYQLTALRLEDEKRYSVAC